MFCVAVEHQGGQGGREEGIRLDADPVLALRERAGRGALRREEGDAQAAEPAGEGGPRRDLRRPGGGRLAVDTTPQRIPPAAKL